MSIKIGCYDKFKPISNARYIGNFGACYMYHNDIIIKILNEENELLKTINLEKRLKELVKIKIDDISLPIDLVYRNNKFAGYIMPHYNGPTLSNYIKKKINKNIFNFNEICDIYNSLYNKINLLSSKNIIINDIKPDNIIVANNDFCIIDVDFYYIDKKRSKKDILKKNIIELNKGMLKLIKLVVSSKKNNLNGLLELTESADFSIYKYTDEDLENKEFINKLIYSIKNK